MVGSISQLKIFIIVWARLAFKIKYYINKNNEKTYNYAKQTRI